jgi:eukaryotic-like serine/threonine-protein kinase
MEPGRIGYYELLEKIGQGGMGEVWKAHDSRLDRIVALKFLPRQTASNDTEKRRFIHEARAASGLDHPNICSVFSIEETDDGQLYMVMAYYEGESLSEKIGHGPVPLMETINIAMQLATGLQKAHSKNIVHRDLKPANVLITTDGLLKIIDFGLAKAAMQTTLTEAGTTMGTASYMSPEQAQGASVDHRTDIWSFGVLLYEMITGMLPFRSEHSAALVYSILHETPEPVTALRTGVPVALENIVTKCLEKDASDRYQHTDEILVDLRKVEKSLQKSSENRGNQAIPTPLSQIREKNTFEPDSILSTDPNGSANRQLSASTWLLVALLTAVTLGLAGYYLVINTAGPTEGIMTGQLTFRQVTFDTGVDEFPAWSPDGKKIAFSREAGGYRNIFLKDLDTGSERQLTRTRADNIQPTWSPDGKSLLVVRASEESGKIGLSDLYGWYLNGDIWKIDIESQAEERFINNAFNPAWSPDGKRIAVEASWAGPRRIWQLDERGMNPRQITSDISESVYHTSPGWSPDGNRIVFQNIDGTRRDIRVIDRVTEEISWITDDQFTNVHPFWSADDMIYFSSYRGGGINIWRVAGNATGSENARFEQITTGAGQDLYPSVSNDGQNIAFSVLGLNSNIWRLPVSPDSGLPEGDPEPLIMTTREDSRGAWSPDGSRIAFSSDRAGYMNIWLYMLDDGSVRQLTHGPGGDYQPNWSPDGQQIAFFSSRSGQLDIWTVDVENGDLKQITTGPGSDINPFFSPDGSLIAYSSDEFGRLEPWIVASDGTGRHRLISMAINIHFKRWMKQDDRFVFRSADPNRPGLWMITVSGDEPEFVVMPRGGAHISFSPDFSKIMDVENHRTLWVTPVDGSVPYQVYEFEEPDVRMDYPVWSPDGRYVLFDHLRPSGGNIWVVGGVNDR